MIRERTGWERVMALFTDLRKYRCRNCDHIFRAPDRRRMLRSKNRARAEAEQQRAKPLS
jgi:hypothetical protein